MTEFITIPWVALVTSLLVAFGISVATTPLVLKWATKFSLFDMPGGRHLHASPTPRLGGLAIYVGILLAALILLGITPQLVGVYLGMTIVFIIGYLDDRYSLPPAVKLSGQILAASVLVLFGNTITNLTNPFGGNILLPVGIDVLLTIFWTVLIINAINFLDGLDGLASGVSAIAATSIAVLSLFAIVNQPDTAILSAAVLGATLGFLVYNWYPARIFMGDSGSHTLGFMLAALSIISGSKLATAGLVLGLPIIDLIWSSIRRIRSGNTPWTPDQQHFHHRLLEIGRSQRMVVIVFYLISTLFGIIALASGTLVKIISFFLVAVLMWWLAYSRPRG
ncbi:MAG: MraY family glycosyltransferase [Patescibacteria group bacterium]